MLSFNLRTLCGFTNDYYFIPKLVATAKRLHICRLLTIESLHRCMSSTYDRALTTYKLRDKFLLR